MMTIRIRVTKVDRYGYNGREHHPNHLRDEGVEGTITNLELIPNEYNPEPYSAVNKSHDLSRGDQLFHVLLDNGHAVELLGHEIELVGCSHDGDL